MIVLLESTTKEVTVNGVPARLWEGVSTSGVPVHAYITRIAVPEGRAAEHYRQFEEELRECRPPSAAVAAIDARLIL